MRIKRSPINLTSGPIASTLVRLSAPMLVGILAMMAFNVIDTYFVGRLGVTPLAGMTLTFPVVRFVGMFTLGLGVGAMAVISRAIGAGGDRGPLRRCTTDALMLAAVCVGVMVIVGLLTIDPLFRLLGATDEMMPFVRRYMLIWYPGMIFFIVPIVGNNIIRATGDTFTPSIIMLVGVAINAVLDPILIFGWGPIPSMGISGAAIATVGSRSITLVATLCLLHFRERLLTNPWPGFSKLIESWKVILVIGLPVGVSNSVIPIAIGFLTHIVTRFGEEAVAGFGIATRIEAFGMVLMYALSTGMSPFVGQNLGAGRIDRIQRCLLYAKVFCLTLGCVLMAMFWVFGRGLASCFHHDPAVVAAASLYLWIVPISLGLKGLHQIIWTSLNVLGKPYHSLFLELLMAFGLWLPMSWAGAHFGQLKGMFWGLVVGNILAGLVAYVWVDRVTDREKAIHQIAAAGPEGAMEGLM